jgi:deoxyribodipyrimidine photolyase-related protein
VGALVNASFHDHQAVTLRLILGDQLNPLHPWLAAPRADVVLVMMEVREEAQAVWMHAQKVLGVFAAMRDFASTLKAQGHRVRYVRIGDAHNRQSFTANLSALVAHYGASHVEWLAPDHHALSLALSEWALHAGVTHSAVDSAHFLEPREALARFMGQRRQWTMEHWYRHLRQRHQILVDEQGQPTGGRWNFDADNRKPWRGSPGAPDDWRHTHDHSALWQEIQAAGVSTFGNPQAQAFRWPINRAQALGDLSAFVRYALPYFGDHQDALHGEQPRLFHSLLSFALNLKMLHPREAIDAAVAAHDAGLAPLHAVEGFVRQILGWREYVRGVYWAHMPEYLSRNALGHSRALPAWFWSGQTRMACVHSAITQSLDTGYAHHIQRLMVTGNFALLAGLNPQAVHAWYLGMYVDALEWVEVPNTLGMSQFADGGLLATKPYVSSAAYLQRMGNHCSGCAYNPKQRTGDGACPFNALYWDFFLRHADTLRGNHRLAMVYGQLDKLNDQQRQALQAQAHEHLAQIDTL